MVFCNNCGTNIDETARYCRRCGHPTDLSEVTTRTLQPPPVMDPATRTINQSPTTPSYVPPDFVPPAPVYSTQDLAQNPGHKRAVIVLGGLVVVLFVAFIALAAIMFTRASSSNGGRGGAIGPSPETVITPPPPIRPNPPPPPTSPPLPPLPPGERTAPSNMKELVYPGAEVTMNMDLPEGGSVLTLRTKEPAQKVVDWYVSKLKSVKPLRFAGQALLQLENGTVLITSDGNETNIVVTKGGPSDSSL